jgi:hypothetical protein
MVQLNAELQVRVCTHGVGDGRVMSRMIRMFLCECMGKTVSVYFDM